MNKILIEVRLPAAGISYDLAVPDTMQIGTMTQLVAAVFTKLSNGVYYATPEAILCEQKTGKEYDMNLRIYETDIRNGTKFYLY